MANISKRGDKWRAEVCIDRKRKAKTFPTKREAVAWANEQEDFGVVIKKTLADAIKQYRPIAMERKGAQSELSRLKQLENSFIGTLPLEYLTPAKIAEYRDRRLQEVAPVSVRRELIILSGILRLANEEWGWISTVPTRKVRKPHSSPPRRRGISNEEIEKICNRLKMTRIGKQTEDVFRISLETGMRLSEICEMKWEQVFDKHVVLPDTKNGDRRSVPLSVEARRIIEERRAITGGEERLFSESSETISKAFQRARTAAGCPDVHLHDARSEAITRLSKKLDVMQLAKMIGHRDLKSLMIYYAEPAEAIADLL